LERSDPGEEFCVFDIPGKGRCGLCICYDQWFPEVVRSLTWMGAEVIFCPTATYTSDRSLELVLAQANAGVNQVYFLNVNGVGGGGIGQSIFVDAEGRVLSWPSRPWRGLAESAHGFGLFKLAVEEVDLILGQVVKLQCSVNKRC
jgi:predicted amidohydrolase